MAIKTLEIDSFSEEDIQAMFEAICKQVLDVPIMEMKRKIFGNINEKQLAGAKIKLSHLLNLVAEYKIKYSFRVEYLKTEVNRNKGEAPELTIGLKKDHSVTEMERQEQAITNPDLLDIKASPSAVVSPVKAPNTLDNISPQDIPDFKF